jgi:hypothetical protein
LIVGVAEVIERERVEAVVVNAESVNVEAAYEIVKL